MRISAVIPTCDRKLRLLNSLAALNRSSHPLWEVIIIDAGSAFLEPADYAGFQNLAVTYLKAPRSVCIQRNIGIEAATGDWIYLCDDDIETPADYLGKLVAHVQAHPSCGAVSGLVLQPEKDGWKASYPITSSKQLIWTWLFSGSIWGKLECVSNHTLIKQIRRSYARKGNHLSRAGWPVITQFSDPWFETPVFGLGASLVRREWLTDARYDEVLDSHGIGDNYGVAIQFPAAVQVLTGAFVYHHQEMVNRLHRPLQYYRRVLAMDYFRKMQLTPPHVKKYWLLWSLTGNLMAFLFVRERRMIRPALRSLWMVLLGRNPYYRAARAQRKVESPML